MSKPVSKAARRCEVPVEHAAVPVIEERLEIAKREVETGRVRVTKLVRESQEVVDVPLLTEQVSVERVPVGRIVDAAPEPRQEGDTLVLPVLEEVVVVEKRLMLKEEIRVTRTRGETHRKQTVPLRKEEVQVQRLPPCPPAGDSESQPPHGRRPGEGRGTGDHERGRHLSRRPKGGRARKEQ